MPFATVVELEALDGAHGFQINGEFGSGLAGWSVASAGDVNGDGLTDLIIGAPTVRPDGVNETGVAYVVFGRNTEMDGDFLTEVDLATLNGLNGFEIRGEIGGGRAGHSVSSAGDINGDGIGDLLVGAPSAYLGGSFRGASYVVFGRDTSLSGDFAGALNLADLDGTDGFRITGDDAFFGSGLSVESAGDLNHDGIGDLVIGSVRDPNGPQSGVAWVVFGKDTAVEGGFLADLDLTALNGTDGFQINGEMAGSRLGASVASAGDVNDDGIDDLIIGAWATEVNGIPNVGAAYVLFGKDTAVDGAFAAEVEVSGLNGANGFQLSGVSHLSNTGWSVASTGDINGDGLDDLLIGAPVAERGGVYPGAAYVVFGSASGFPADLDLGLLDGSDGFRIDGIADADAAGWSVSSAGDINGDGVADLAVGAYTADTASDPTELDSGATYIIFGHTGTFAATLALAALDGLNGFQIVGEPFNQEHSGFSVGSLVDFNGDGVSDLVIGAPHADPGGNSSGAAYVVFGRGPSVTFNGTAADEAASGSTGADNLFGGAGKDVLSGLAGPDDMDGEGANDVLYGGLGADDLIGGDGNDWLQGDDGNDQLTAGDGADKLFGGLGLDSLQGGAGADRLDGGTGNDSLDGGGGNDLLDGGLGADAMTGGLGNDVFVVDDFGDTTIEAVGEGYDILRTALDGWVLGDNIEALELQGSADIDGQGNGLANNLQGNSGGNTLFGGAGVDTINGADGDDEIIGGTGNDLLRGGLGADVFIVNHAFGATLETDQVYDFSAAEGDIIDLSGAFAGTIEKVDAFGKVAGEMTLTFAGGITTLRLDVTGDGKVDYQMKLNGDVTGDWGDWLL